jgi:hypothetical protein
MGKKPNTIGAEKQGLKPDTDTLAKHVRSPISTYGNDMGNVFNNLAAGALVLVAATSANAADWVIGAGSSDFSGHGAPTETLLNFEIHGNPWSESGRFKFGPGIGATFDSAGDVWVGIGLSALYDLDPWFLEASVMPGYYNAASNATDLGSDIVIRSLVGVGYNLSDTMRVSVAVDHRSNANFGTINPGVNSFSLRLRQSF